MNLVDGNTALRSTTEGYGPDEPGTSAGVSATGAPQSLADIRYDYTQDPNVYARLAATSLRQQIPPDLGPLQGFMEYWGIFPSRGANESDAAYRDRLVNALEAFATRIDQYKGNPIGAAGDAYVFLRDHVLNRPDEMLADAGRVREFMLYAGISPHNIGTGTNLDTSKIISVMNELQLYVASKLDPLSDPVREAKGAAAGLRDWLRDMPGTPFPDLRLMRAWMTALGIYPAAAGTGLELSEDRLRTVINALDLYVESKSIYDFYEDPDRTTSYIRQALEHQLANPADAPLVDLGAAWAFLKHYGLLPADAGDGKAPSEAQIRSALNGIVNKELEWDYKKDPDLHARQAAASLRNGVPVDVNALEGFMAYWGILPTRDAGESDKAYHDRLALSLETFAGRIDLYRNDPLGTCKAMIGQLRNHLLTRPGELLPDLGWVREFLQYAGIDIEGVRDDGKNLDAARIANVMNQLELYVARAEGRNPLADPVGEANRAIRMLKDFLANSPGARLPDLGVLRAWMTAIGIYPKAAGAGADLDEKAIVNVIKTLELYVEREAIYDLYEDPDRSMKFISRALAHQLSNPADPPLIDLGDAWAFMTHYGLLPAGAGDGKAPSEAQLRSVVNALEIKRFESHFEDFRKTPDITANRLKDPLLLFLKTSPGQLLSDLGEIKGFLMLWDMYPPELGDGTNLTEKDIQKVVDLLDNFSVKAYAYRAIGKLPKFNAPGFDSAPNESMKLVLANLGIKDVPFVDMNATSWKKEEWRLIHLKVLEAYQKMPGEVPSSPAPAPTPSDPGQTPSPGQPTKPWAPVQAATRSMSAAHAALLDRIINETGAGFPVLLPPEIQAFLANWGVKLNGIDPTQPLDLGQTRQVATYLETMSKTFSTKNYVQSVIDGLPQFYSPNFSGADSEAIKRALKNLGIETIPGVDMNKAVFGYNEFVLVLIKLKSIQQQI